MMNIERGVGFLGGLLVGRNMFPMLHTQKEKESINIIVSVCNQLVAFEMVASKMRTGCVTTLSYHLQSKSQSALSLQLNEVRLHAICF